MIMQLFSEKKNNPGNAQILKKTQTTVIDSKRNTKYEYIYRK